MQLSEDIYSVFRKDHLYGKCGDVVRVISKHGDVVVVEGPDKTRYPVEWAKLEPEPPPNVKKAEVKPDMKPEPKEVVKPISKPTKSGKKKPAKVINQNDLFQ